MKSEIVVWSEYEAYKLLYGWGGSSNQTAHDIHKAADEIILLAEKIKAERATAGMQPH